MISRLILIAAVACTSLAAWSAEISVTVKDADGRPLPDAIVVAVPADRPLILPTRRPTAIEDQIDTEFVPYVNPVLVGTSVTFPNSDNVRHHVYSFSPAKRFELPLYAGTPATPILFDKAGVVVVGCNIHDWMIAYIYVSESPFFAKTGADGAARLENLPAGNYRVRAWHPRLIAAQETTQRAVNVTNAKTDTLDWQLRLRPDTRPRRAPVGVQHKHY